MSWVKTSAPTANWRCVASSSDGTKLVAGISPGGIYTSSDAGRSWTLTSAPSNRWISLASSSDGRKIVACIYGGGSNFGGIYTSSDFGGTWSQTSAPLTSWQSISSSSDGTKLVACTISQGVNIGIYTSFDSGVNWVQRTSAPTSGNWLGVASSSNGSKLVACSELVGIYTSSDSGVTWLQTMAPLTIWRCICSNSDGTKLVACVYGEEIYTSTDSGKTWLPTTSPFGTWRSVASNSEGSIIVACLDSNPSVIYISSDSGLTWIQTNAPSASWRSVVSNSDGTKLGACSFGVGLGSIYINYLSSPMVCFLENSKILTKQGYRPIQDLRKGDLIKTIKHGYVPIDMIGYREIFNPICKERIKDKLYVCTNKEYPEIFEDLVITGCHAILVGNYKDKQQEDKSIEVLGGLFLTDDKCRLPACVDERARPYEKEGMHTIYHIALENDDYFMNYGIYANGLLVETCSKRYLKELSNMTILNL